MMETTMNNVTDPPQTGGKRQAAKEQAALRQQAKDSHPATVSKKTPAPKKAATFDPTKLTGEARSQLKAAVTDHLLAMDVAALSKGTEKYPALKGVNVVVLQEMPTKQANYVRWGSPTPPKNAK